MEDYSLSRMILIVLSALVYIAAMVVNGLAGAGKGPFHTSTGNVSKQYETDVTPAGWTFSIWGLIYGWLTAMVLYLASSLFRGYWSQAVLPYGFYICWISNMVLNMVWLLIWDRELMWAALVVLALMAGTNCCMVLFSCYAVDLYGVWLRHTHPRDLLCLRLLVQNGVSLYTTWTCIATLVNLSVVLSVEGVARDTAGTVSLCALLLGVLGWFILENFVLDRYVRYILTIYPVVIIALGGIVSKHYQPSNPSANAVFSAVLLALTCILFLVRVAMVIWRNRKQPLYSGVSSDHMTSPMMSPDASTNKKRKIFM
ncbi:uncharacterized protein LOC134036856 isoform X1 [Osmerus eperlanus]|uniref:uncharacterized protein LOC134036856 isoform X1 n=1 Tax=Osmerus eperlanus TaxID=29151 RepID=UPI002E0F5AEB